MPIHTYDTQADWLADARRSAPDYHLGATAVRALMGLGYADDGPWSVWADAMSVESATSNGDDRAMSAGRYWEAPAAEWYRLTRHADVDARICRAWSEDTPWLRVSPDALVGSDGLLEIKCPMRSSEWREECEIRSAGSPEAASVPTKHLVQCYAQLAATGRAWCDLVAFLGPHRLQVYRVHRDETYQSAIVAHVAAWREVHLIHGRPPDYDGSSACSAYYASEHLRRQVDEATVATAEQEYAINAWLEARSTKDAAEQQYGASKAALLAALDAKRTTVPGLGRVTIDTRGTPRWTDE